jgi:hypothetical protein
MVGVLGRLLELKRTAAQIKMLGAANIAGTPAAGQRLAPPFASCAGFRVIHV